MRLLLTRAVQDATRTRAKLEAAGHSVVCAPVIAIEPSGAKWPTGIVDAVLATSGHAFTPFLGAAFPTLEARRLTPLFLVGARTEEAARECGFLGETLVAPNATVLALQLRKLIRKQRHLVYLAGRDRKPDLETALDVTEQPVNVIETYDAKPAAALEAAALDGLRLGTIDGVLHFSRRSATLFISLAKPAGPRLRLIRHFCLSEDVAAPLREAQVQSIDVAEAPNEAALVDLIPSVAYA